ncbi:MAG: hypothetical protein IJA48_05615, partial [Oscillospiraceae bacterium]|nr:hypothetical protein [Oscillospiraceae bacterium]
AQGISSTNQIENLGSHLPLTREALGAADRPINIDMTVMPTATPCVPLQRGKSLIGGAFGSSRNIDLTAVRPYGGWLVVR